MCMPQSQNHIYRCEVVNQKRCMKSDHYPIVTTLMMTNKRRIKRTFRASQSGCQFGGDNDKCKFNDMFSFAFSFSGKFVSISTNVDLQNVETALQEGMDSVTGSTRSERRRGLFDKPLALSRAQTAVIDIVRKTSNSHEDRRIARRTENVERKKWNAHLSTLDRRGKRAH